jgi:DNA repair protein RecO (recombination protein O)
MSINRSEAIVLRARKVRETSKIVVFFTKRFGKVSAMAKGCLRPKSKFGSSLEILTHSLIIYYSKENRNVHTLSHSETLNPFTDVKADFAKLAYASVVVEILERLTPPEEPNEELFKLALTALREFDAAAREDLEIILGSYLLKLLQLAGYGPSLTRCVRCGRKTGEGEESFGLLSGGVLCKACVDRDINAVDLDPDVLELLKSFEKKTVKQARKDPVPETTSRGACDILTAFLRMVMGEGSRVKSLDFLERIRDKKYA